MLNLLTADSRGVSESLVNIRVHVNEKIFGHCHRVVSILDLLLDPVSEGSTNDSSCHVDYPLLWQTNDLFMVVREVVKAH